MLLKLAFAAALLESAAVMAAPPVFAMGGADPAPATAANADFAAGKAAIQAKAWTGAIAALNKAAATMPKDADVQNYLGYAYRNAGDFGQAFAHYQVALRLNPDHRGAHEYLGEAYLLQNQLPQAEAQLSALDNLCLFGCAEYTELKAKVAAYKRQHGGS
jgi:Flp pilus assembly protein TadD